MREISGCTINAGFKFIAAVLKRFLIIGCCEDGNLTFTIETFVAEVGLVEITWIQFLFFYLD